MKELGGKTGVLVGLDLHLAAGGTEADVRSPHWGNFLSQRETFKAESETAHLWQPKWNENLSSPQPYIPPTGTQVPWKAQWL